MLAKKVSTVDEISDGRLILGLGAGWNQTEYDAYGFPFDHRVSRFEEAFTIIRTLLTEGDIDFVGEYYSASDCVLVPPARAEAIPMMIGSEGPRMLAATLPHVQMWNGWHAWYGNSVAGAKTLLAKIDAACADAAVDPVSIERTLAVLVQAPGGTDRRQGSPGRASSTPVSGGVSAVVDHILGLEALGVSHVQLVVDPITTDSIRWLAGVISGLD
jgi:alkanesulfonate monooxygenase SsuD/methylene tetrahydromethanopterin reductase-like flavin-dependent oxidoreductase (luciferase family)